MGYTHKKKKICIKFKQKLSTKGWTKKFYIIVSPRDTKPDQVVFLTDKYLIIWFLWANQMADCNLIIYNTKKIQQAFGNFKQN